MSAAASAWLIYDMTTATETPRQAVLSAVEKLDPKKAIACILNQTYSSGDALEYGQYPAYGEFGE